MNSGPRQQPDPPKDPANIDANDFVTNQEPAVVPVFAGEAMLTITLICEPFGIETREAKDAPKGKK